MSETVCLKKQFHYLLIDDSEMIRSQFSQSIYRICEENNYSHQVFEFDRQGHCTVQAQKEFNTNNDYYVYTAARYKQALQVLELPGLTELTVVCDLAVPYETQVGILDFLQTLTRLCLRVNLIFISDDYQNRTRVERLLNHNKAFFIQKGTLQWHTLPIVLINWVSNFHYPQLTLEDFTVRMPPTSTQVCIDHLSEATFNIPAAQPEVVALSEVQAVLTEQSKPHLVAKLVSAIRDLSKPADSGELNQAQLREFSRITRKPQLSQVGIVGRHQRNFRFCE